MGSEPGSRTISVIDDKASSPHAAALVASRRRRVHPRVCGEHGGQHLVAEAVAGSSPRVRGTPLFASLVHGQFRFIPACAGNTHQLEHLALHQQVHPRVCGEHRHAHRHGRAQRGSSPRVRGTPNIHAHLIGILRFIPACAGNTGGGLSYIAWIPVHPRVCGEHFSPDRINGLAGGSSPRVRGTRHQHLLDGKRRRFIPACAGNTVLRAFARPVWPVHPRVCGEHRRGAGRTSWSGGSSPRVRGTPQRRQHIESRRRFIPACAGNTASPSRSAWTMSVHPRVCGEHAIVKTSSDTHDGSSPRVRGTRVTRQVRVRGGRFIPACAGNTPAWPPP